MSTQLTSGATLTGGTTVTLSPAGISPGRSSFVGPTHTRLAPVTVDLSVSQIGTTPSNPGKAHSGCKIRFADRLVEEGCCTVKAGSVTVNVGIDWDLSQPETLKTNALAYLRGIVYTQWFDDMITKGILPSS